MTRSLHKPHPDHAIEARAEQIYLARNGAAGGVWWAVETPEPWWGMAEEEAALAALPNPGHGEREHSELSASSCYRWWNCPGSVALSRGVKSRDSLFAAEGTAAHELAELCLLNKQHAVEYIDRVFTVDVNGEPVDFVVDDAMADAVQAYLDFVGSVYGELSVEKRIRLDAIGAPAPMFGTCDAFVYDQATQTLHIVDLKYGKGKRVIAQGNPQGLYYARGAILGLGPDQPAKRVLVTIAQVRVRDGITTAEYSVMDLFDWTNDLLDHAEAALAPDAPLVPGDWCDYCPVKACKARAAANLEAAQIAFAEAVDPDATLALPQPVLLSVAELSALKAKGAQVRAFFDAVDDAVEAELRAGRGVPDWKLVESEARVEKWRESQPDVVGALVKAGISPWQPQKLSSPAQARGKLTEAFQSFAAVKVTKKAAEEKARKVLAPLLYKPRTVKCVPATDARPAVSGGDHGLLALPDETTEAKV